MMSGAYSAFPPFMMESANDSMDSYMSDSIQSSGSTMAIQSPVASSIALFIESPYPVFSFSIILKGRRDEAERSRRMSSVPSVEPSSTATISMPSCVCASMLSRHLPSVPSTL